MSESFVVTLDRKSYTWEGGRWYGTLDHTKPSLGLIHRLNALLPKVPEPKTKKRAAASSD
jgi:hypothetical protein